MELAGIISTTVGTIFLFLGSLGIFRMPDVYNRLQAGTKCTTLGAFLTVIGVGLIHPDWLLKTLVIAVFIIATNPISNHALGRAARKAGIALCDRSVVDRTEDFQQGEVEQ
jgi:multicomponent Na+:H+ antiporter subunit G